jgi:hypothetical protein
MIVDPAARAVRFTEDVMDPYRRTPPLSPEGSREVEEEMARPPADTPERRALFERVRMMAEGHRRSAATEQDSTPPPDHEGFVEVRSIGLRAMRQKLADRRKHS